MNVKCLKNSIDIKMFHHHHHHHQIAVMELGYLLSRFGYILVTDI